MCVCVCVRVRARGCIFVFRASGVDGDCVCLELQVFMGTVCV